MSGGPLRGQRATLAKTEKNIKKQVKAKNADNQAKAKQQGIGPGADQFYCFLSHILLAVAWYCVTNEENGYGAKRKKPKLVPKATLRKRKNPTNKKNKAERITTK